MSKVECLKKHSTVFIRTGQCAVMKYEMFFGIFEMGKRRNIFINNYPLRRFPTFPANAVIWSINNLPNVGYDSTISPMVVHALMNILLYS